MARKKVFFSYHYEKDGNRVDEIRSMGLTRDVKPVSKEDWAEIFKTNIKRFEAILRANPNDESARWYLENTKNLLVKLYSQGS